MVREVRPIRQAVALAILNSRHPHRVLVVKRPEEAEEELPGVWGLPAASLRPGEGPQEAARRVAREKLSVETILGEALAHGNQPRKDYTLVMTVYRAYLQGDAPRLPSPPPGTHTTFYTSWRWADPDILRESANQGSLCCQLFLGSCQA